MKKKSNPECKSSMVLGVIEFITEMDGRINFVNDNLISVDSHLWQVIVDEKGSGEILLSFHVNMDPCIAARIMGIISELSETMNMKIAVGDVYAFKIDKDGNFVDMVFGYDAYKIVGREPEDRRTLFREY